MMIVPNQLRAQTTAAYYFAINVLGLTIGSTAIALVTDYVFGDDAASPPAPCKNRPLARRPGGGMPCYRQSTTT